MNSIGIVDEGNKLSLAEDNAISQFEKRLKLDGERYEVSLPSRENHPKVRDNYSQVVKRLESVEKQLLGKPIKAEAYMNSINQYHEKRFAEEVKNTGTVFTTTTRCLSP